MGRLDTKNTKALVAFKEANKSFGATKALINCNISFKLGCIHSLVGENGAGKSTLGKLILGAHTLDSGQMYVDGDEVAISSPVQSVNLGLVGISQELSLLASRSVTDNIVMGREKNFGPFVSDKVNRETALDVMEKYDIFLEPDAIVGTLSVAEQQKVEILRALNSEARLIVFDEPTARLASHEAEKLHLLVRTLAENGAAIVYISHFLEEVLKISDEISLLRNGELIRTNKSSYETKNSLIEGMTGKEQGTLYPKKLAVKRFEDPILKVENLTRKGEFKDISFELYKGEILGLAGLVGSGRSELAHTIYGDTMPDSGDITFCEEKLTSYDVATSIKMGMALVPESRRSQGLILSRPLLENISLPHLKKFASLFGVNKSKERQEVILKCEQTKVKYRSIEDEAEYLSGGNQQKLLFTRAAMGKPKLLIADEPTRGVDIGAKRAIYELISKRSEVGESVLLISSEIEEIIGISNRVLVMSRGSISAELRGSEITKKAIMEAAFREGNQ